MLSVILPVYQVEKYLDNAVDCLIRQNIEDIEIILVDDGSTDGSAQICDSLAKRYDCVTSLHQKNSGVSSARNKGLKAARGEYIAFLDPDDYIDDGYYKQLLDALVSTGSDIVFSKYKRFYEDSGRLENVDENGFELLEGKELDLSLFFANLTDVNNDKVLMGYVWRSIFKKSIIDENNLTFNENIAFSEDLLFLLEYLSHCKKISTLDLYGYNYLVRSSSATAVSYKKSLYNNRKHCLNEFIRIFDLFGNKDKEILINRIKYSSAKEIIYNEMRFNKNAIKTLNEYISDGFLNEFLDDCAIRQAKEDNIEKSNLIILMLAKRKLFSPIRLLYSIKYKNEQE